METLLPQLLGLAIRGLVSYLGVQAANEVLDQTRQKMVDDQRGPNDAELNGLLASIKARSDRIQNA